MPKTRRKPFGNKKLDKMQKTPAPLSLLADDKGKEKRLLLQAITVIQTLEELLAHYKIDRQNPEKWFLLCLRLASDFVPAMHFAKRKGKSAQWTEYDDLALYAIINFRHAGSGKPYSMFYKAAYKDAEGTKLSRLVNKRTAAKTIENRYQRFKSSEFFKQLKRELPKVVGWSESGVLFTLVVLADDYRLEDKD